MKTERSINIESRREPFVDDYLIDRMRGIELRLHHPEPRNVVLRFSKPWEGNTCGYYVVFRDGDVFRMYYRGSVHDRANKNRNSAQVVCYAESRDGIRWTRPELGIHADGRSKRNNIIWTGQGSHNFAPFKDANPDCKPSGAYKALGGSLNHTTKAHLEETRSRIEEALDAPMVRGT